MTRPAEPVAAAPTGRIDFTPPIQVRVVMTVVRLAIAGLILVRPPAPMGVVGVDAVLSGAVVVWLSYLIWPRSRRLRWLLYAQPIFDVLVIHTLATESPLLFAYVLPIVSARLALPRWGVYMAWIPTLQMLGLEVIFPPSQSVVISSTIAGGMTIVTLLVTRWFREPRWLGVKTDEPADSPGAAMVLWRLEGNRIVALLRTLLVAGSLPLFIWLPLQTADQSSDLSWGPYSILGAALFVSLIYLLLQWNGWHRAIEWTASVFDTVLVTLLVLVTGGIESFYLFAYAFPILVAGRARYRRAGLYVWLSTLLLLAVVLFAQVSRGMRVLPPVGETMPFITFFMHTVTMGLVALFASNAFDPWPQPRTALTAFAHDFAPRGPWSSGRRPSFVDGGSPWGLYAVAGAFALVTMGALSTWPGWATSGMLAGFAFVTVVVGHRAAAAGPIAWTEVRYREKLEALLQKRLGAQGGDRARMAARVLAPRRSRGVQALSSVTGSLTQVNFEQGWALVEGRWTADWPSTPEAQGATEEEGRFAYVLRFQLLFGALLGVRRAGRIWWSSERFESLVDLVPLAGGTFLMGSPPDDEMAYDHERPQHPQSVDAFGLARTPVTNAVWRAVMQGDPDRTRAMSTLPKVGVDWFEAIEFLDQCSRLAGREACHRHPARAWWSRFWKVSSPVVRDPSKDGFRLPTEAEWEFACRAGTSTRWWFGDDSASLAKYAWYSKNSYGRLQPVRRKPANPFGLYDMQGLIWQWCWDDYGSYPRPDLPTHGPPAGDLRVIRGGSFGSQARDLRSADRGRWRPGDRDPDLGLSLCGSFASRAWPIGP